MAFAAFLWFALTAGAASSFIITPKGIGIAFDTGTVTKDTFTGTFSNRQAHFLIGPHFGFTITVPGSWSPECIALRDLAACQSALKTLHALRR